RIRIDEDLAAALASNSELRSKLDDAVQEAVALKEQQTATDVFSLELKDYEKKATKPDRSGRMGDTNTFLLFNAELWSINPDWRAFGIRVASASDEALPI
ncbi:unnamed protein product, partial [Cylicostephanus goldi]